MKLDISSYYFLLVLIVILILVLNENKENLTGNKNKKHKKKIYDPNNFRRYRKKLSQEILRKELNRDFNYEVPLFYKTPYQFLDYQDLFIHEYDRIYNAKPEEIDARLLKYTI